MPVCAAGLVMRLQVEATWTWERVVLHRAVMSWHHCLGGLTVYSENWARVLRLRQTIWVQTMKAESPHSQGGKKYTLCDKWERRYRHLKFRKLQSHHLPAIRSLFGNYTCPDLRWTKLRTISHLPRKNVEARLWVSMSSLCSFIFHVFLCFFYFIEGGYILLIYILCKCRWCKYFWYHWIWGLMWHIFVLLMCFFLLTTSSPAADFMFSFG